jgi:hypothetical protein
LHIIYGLLLFWQSVAYLTIRRQGSDKDKKKENSERDERAKKVCITFKAFFFPSKLSLMKLFLWLQFQVIYVRFLFFSCSLSVSMNSWSQMRVKGTTALVAGVVVVAEAVVTAGVSVVGTALGSSLLRQHRRFKINRSFPHSVGSEGSQAAMNSSLLKS